MKHYFLILSAFLCITLNACKDDDDDKDSVYEYHAHIHSPNTMEQQIGNTLFIEVEFESHTGEIIHHINVRVFNKATLAEVYNLPVDPHINELSGEYLYMDEFLLSAANGLSAGDWIVEAKVWGEEDGQEETTEQVEFHIQ